MQCYLLFFFSGFLASTYHRSFGDAVHAETIHAAFQIDIKTGTSHSCNWKIAQYDLVLIDEISMIPRAFASTIISTLESAPRIAVFCGDQCQLQPFGNDVSTCQSLFDDHAFLMLCKRTRLRRQFRTLDPILQQFLADIRNVMATQNMIERFCKDIVISTAAKPADDDIISAYENNKRHSS